MRNRPHSILCILPPYMLEHIVENGSVDQKDMAAQTLELTERFREEREVIARQIPTPVAAGLVARQRVVYSAGHLTNLPGQIVRQEGEPPSGDLAVDEAYDGAGATYDLYWNIYQRSSIDGNGMRMDSTVHYQDSYDNAFWNGKQMVYGDGDENLPPEQRLFNRFTIALDVIGHELTHGVTQFTGNLNYSNQSGALNESFSDVFGSLVKQYKLGQLAVGADWIIGEGLFTANVNAQGIRSMKAPGTAYDDPVLGKDPQPAHIKDYVNTINDNGGVHINSGIPNHAFYLTAVAMGGFAWEKAGKIWYITLRDRVRANATFQEAANLTHTVAGELYGVNSQEQQAVVAGWAGVGITVGASANTGCLPGLMKSLGLR